MALNPESTFLGKVNPADANYPWGSAKNVSAQGAQDGTPFVDLFINDIWGFFQKLMLEAGVVPNDLPDTVLLSQYYEAASQLFGVDPGFIGFWPDTSIPDGWLIANGAAVSRMTYASLFSVIGTSFGPGDGVTTFDLPDLRGQFPRFLDLGAGVDPDAATRLDRGDGVTGDQPGTLQLDDYGSHFHRGGGAFDGGEADDVDLYGFEDSGLSTPDSVNTQGASGSETVYTSTEGGLETRPVNIALIGLIKY